jgi:alkylation response protein AidB-like acyl-CoA dehydrogenase
VDHALVALPDLRPDPAEPVVTEPDWLARLIAQAVAAGEDIATSLALTRAYGALLPLPGERRTAQRWAALSALGRANLTVARVFEAHTDALAILAEAGVPDDASELTYGVFAAEGGGDPVRATCPAGQFYLSGVKPWCSLGSELDAGLVTAHVTGGRQLFRVDLHDPSVTAEPTIGWVARGLRTVTSTSLRFAHTPAQPIGDVDWYLARPGFSWGGIGVAACWYGGALGLQDRLSDTVTDPLDAPLDALRALHLGTVDAALHAAGAVLDRSATVIDEGGATGAAGQLLALRTRAVVADAVERTIREVGHALGPAPLAFDEEHARRVADLTLYVRQHHAERDLAELGRAVAGVVT